jgi:hypothetical protein
LVTKFMKEANRLLAVIFLLIAGISTNYRQIIHNIPEKIKPMHCIGFINRLIRKLKNENSLLIRLG